MSYDALWQRLMFRQGRQNGTREMVEIIKLGKKHGYRDLQTAVEAAEELGCSDIGAVVYLLSAEKLKRQRPEAVDIGDLTRYERPMPELGEYDLLLQAVAQ